MNRSVQRTAKLLGLAVLAFLLLGAFDKSLDSSVDALDLPSSQKAALRAEEVNLGANDILAGARGEDRVVIDQAVDQAFIGAFRLAMLVSAGMALTSAVAAALLIQGKKSDDPDRPGPRATA